MINVYVHCANKSDATSWYRAWGTFPDIEKRSDIRFHDMTKIFPKLSGKKLKDHLDNLKKRGIIPKKDEEFLIYDWTESIKADITYFQRPMDNTILEFAITQKLSGSKIWYDLDDNLWEIPGSYDIKKNIGYNELKNIAEFIELSDIITVSTLELKNYVDSKFGVNCIVINNGIDFDKYPINETSTTGLTLWRGSPTHADDIEKFRDYFESFDEVLFMGYNPITNKPKLKVNGELLPTTDVGLYYNTLKNINPSYLLCFLSDNVFNRCKSNISYLEATLSGAISVNNQVGEFKGKGYDINNGLQLTLDQVHELRAEAVADCLENYHLKKLNDIRINLITTYAKL